MKYIIIILCAMLISCGDPAEDRWGTVLEVNDTGAKIEWDDGTTESKRVMGAVFSGDRICGNPRGASVQGCKAIIH